ncbi:XK-related protein 6 [Galendromus occidentalis]|uniref:XK-related protein n=1 Tax=Galendromus occidentalis TaxID=34638 RepID=A0AAJ7PB59_9ACAR|nr:XK-related protein 6 [Galendromus occidentalis]
MSDVKLLPICDILFVFASLLIFFCDVLFSCLLAYSLVLQDHVLWPIVFSVFIFVSSVLCQGFSFKWHVRSRRERSRRNPVVDDEPMWITHVVVFVHCLQLGVIWRYLRLFIPVEIASVKELVRDLCMLRVIHAFAQSVPLLLMQLHLVLSKSQEEITDLDKVAASFALVSVCWALASFGKNVRRKNMDRLVLTWLGIVCQFFWRLGTVSARFAALSLYTVLYGAWIFLLLLLHWLTVFLWLLTSDSPRDSDADLGADRKMSKCALVACLYTIDYVNLEENASKLKLSAFYSVMLFENLLLVLLWCLVDKKTKIVWFESHAILLVWAGFLLGIMFMFLYYKFFHINVLKQLYSDGASELPRPGRLPPSKFQKTSNMETTGVFNCVLNRGISRKKKKPSAFVPPPNVTFQPGVKMSQPFWKRLSLSRESDSSMMNSDHIKSKLEQKHRKQLMELQKIQEEMQSGRLDALGVSTPMPPHLHVEPPRVKSAPWNGNPEFSYGNNAALLQRMMNFPLQYGAFGPKIAESMDGDNDTTDTERIPPDALYREQGSRGKSRQSRPRVRSHHFTMPHTQL